MEAKIFDSLNLGWDFEETHDFVREENFAKANVLN